MNKSPQFKKIFVIVADSLGIGAYLDADQYNDLGANTLGHILKHQPNLFIPTLSKLGLTRLINLTDFTNQQDIAEELIGKALRLCPISVGKDTLTGHFELMGLEVKTPFKTFTETGFPQELITKIEQYSKRPVIGNYSASGTEIIKDLGLEQIKTNGLIVYTSADSVLQVAANIDYIPLTELYDVCQYIRKITIENPQWMVGRIIARPYRGTNPQNFQRTTDRHDYALKPFGPTALDDLVANGYQVIGIGKINDIFDGQGITKTYSTKSNQHGMDLAIEVLRSDFEGLCFVNLVDFDALYGHRRDPQGYGNAIANFDQNLAKFISIMDQDTLLLVTADHGNDPTHYGTDHTREYVPLLIYYPNITPMILPDQLSFGCVGQTILANFKITPTIKIGKPIDVNKNN